MNAPSAMELLVAVIDSGVNASHPHVGAIAGGRAFLPLLSSSPGAARRTSAEGEASWIEGDDVTDRIGHGTACAGAIREICPAARLLAVKVFDRDLTATSETLARALTWALARGARLCNLSLGVVPGLRDQGPLEDALDAAERLGALVVAARPPAGGAFDGSLLARRREILLAAPDASLPPDRIALFAGHDPAGPTVFLASPHARRIEGVPQARNLYGASLAAARLTGHAALAWPTTGPLSTESWRRTLHSVASAPDAGGASTGPRRRRE